MNAPSPSVPPLHGLSGLHELPLDDYHQGMLDIALKTCTGPVAYCHRIKAEARDLVALAQYSGRIHIHWLYCSAGLRAKLELEVPVGCLPDPNGPLQIAPRALLGLVYPQEAIVRPRPGYAFVHILEPRVWHSNVSPDHNQVLCLGPRLPAGVLVKDILVMTYGALSMQTIQINPRDPAGLLNPAAAEWFQRNTGLIPLTREPFLRGEVKHAA